MKILRWLPVFLYLAGLGYFLIQLSPVRPQLPAHIVIALNRDSRPNAFDTNEFVIFLAFVSLFAPVPFSGSFWRLRSMDPESVTIPIPRKNYWQRPENWQRGCDTLFFSSFWLALAQLIYWMGLFSLIVQANQQHSPSIDSGSLDTLWGYCTAAILAWAVYAVWFVYRSPSDAA